MCPDPGKAGHHDPGEFGRERIVAMQTRSGIPSNTPLDVEDVLDGQDADIRHRRTVGASSRGTARELLHHTNTWQHRLPLQDRRVLPSNHHGSPQSTAADSRYYAVPYPFYH